MVPALLLVAAILENWQPFGWRITVGGVPRLGGARGKKQVWRSHVRTKSLSEANVLHCRKYLRHCWDFSTPPAVIRRPGKCYPLVTPRYALDHSVKRCERVVRSSEDKITFASLMRSPSCCYIHTSRHSQAANTLQFKSTAATVGSTDLWKISIFLIPLLPKSSAEICKNLSDPMTTHKHQDNFSNKIFHMKSVKSLISRKTK